MVRKRKSLRAPWTPGQRWTKRDLPTAPAERAEALEHAAEHLSGLITNFLADVVRSGAVPEAQTQEQRDLQAVLSGWWEAVMVRRDQEWLARQIACAAVEVAADEITPAAAVAHVSALIQSGQAEPEDQLQPRVSALSDALVRGERGPAQSLETRALAAYNVLAAGEPVTIRPDHKLDRAGNRPRELVRWAIEARAKRPKQRTETTD